MNHIVAFENVKTVWLFDDQNYFNHFQIILILSYILN